MPTAPDISRERLQALALSAVPSQYNVNDAPVFHAVLRAIVDVLWEEIGKPIADVKDWPSPGSLSGGALDWLGLCLGINRPHESTSEFFGFDGTEADVGKPFDQAPFFTSSRAILETSPIGDLRYRALVRWRSFVIGGSPSYGEMRNGIASAEDGYIGFEGLTITRSGDREVTVSAGSNVTNIQRGIWLLISGLRRELSRSIFPQTAGVEYTFEEIT